MTKAVDPSKAANYMIKAESSLNIAKIAITQQAYDNAVMSAVHSAINALDALTIQGEKAHPLQGWDESPEKIKYFPCV